MLTSVKQIFSRLCSVLLPLSPQSPSKLSQISSLAGPQFQGGEMHSCLPPESHQGRRIARVRDAVRRRIVEKPPHWCFLTTITPGTRSGSRTRHRLMHTDNTDTPKRKKKSTRPDEKGNPDALGPESRKVTHYTLRDLHPFINPSTSRTLFQRARVKWRRSSRRPMRRRRRATHETSGVSAPWGQTQVVGRTRESVQWAISR